MRVSQPHADRSPVEPTAKAPARPDAAAAGSGLGHRLGSLRRARVTRGLTSHVWLLGIGLMCAAPTACKSGPDLAADYAQTARENYELALGEYSDEDWDEAIQYADFVRIRFPFSRYAVEAELLIARAEFEQGNFLTSQDAFRQFSKLHPTHKHVRNGWVSYMAAVAAYMNGPQGFFLLPPPYQRDQSRLQDALLELEYFFDHYGDSPSSKNAIALRDEINRRLLEHELYVARFYLDREKPEAAIGRLESAHSRYPGIGLDAEVLFLLGVTYLRMEEIELARSTFSELQSQHPKHHHGKQASVYLRHIFDNYGPADPTRERPDRSPPVPLPPAKPKNSERPERPDLADESEPTPESDTPIVTPPTLTVPNEDASEESEEAAATEADETAVEDEAPPSDDGSEDAEESAQSAESDEPNDGSEADDTADEASGE